MEKERISAFQMAVMMYPTILATAILLVPAITGKHAGRDMWLSPLWASSVGFFTVYLAYRLHRLYPGQTLMQYSEQILGRIAGKGLGFLYLFYFLHLTGIILREYADFVVGNFLPKTPILVVTASLLLVCAAAVRGGLEVIGRAAEVFGPVVTVLIAVVFLSLIPDLEPANMLPVMEKGITPSLVGAVIPMGWFSEFLLVSFLFPFLVDQKRGLRWGMIAVAGVTATLVLSNLAALFLLGGELSAKLTYPVMMAARYISIADFLEGIEVVVMAMWVAGTFVKICVFYYALSLGTAQWLGLGDYRPLVLPLGLLIAVFGVWVSSNLPELTHFLGTTSPFYLMFFDTFIPMCLLVIALLRQG